MHGRLIKICLFWAYIVFYLCTHAITGLAGLVGLVEWFLSVSLSLHSQSFSEFYSLHLILSLNVCTAFSEFFVLMKSY